MVAVGGAGSGVLLEGPLSGPLAERPVVSGLLQGVAITAEGRGFASGAGGVMLERTGDRWVPVSTGLEVTAESLHAVWIDPDGGVWAAGGNVLGPRLDGGTLIHYGRSVGTFPYAPPAEVVDPKCPENGTHLEAGLSMARRWNEVLLDAIRRDIPNPPVHARNLYHLGAAMWDAWAAYDPAADGVFYAQKHTAPDVAPARDAAIAHAAFGLLRHRYSEVLAVGAKVSQDCFRKQLEGLGLDPANTSVEGDEPAAVGNRVAAAIIAAGKTDGSNEDGRYADTTGYARTQPPLVVDDPRVRVGDPAVWQELTLLEAETQNGIPVDAGVQTYVGAQWREVTPFAMVRSAPGTLYHDPGPAPAFDARTRAEAVDILVRHSKLDPALEETIDISPSAYGNNPLGTNDGRGHPMNPVTGQPYAPNVVKLGDFARVLAELWADGPTSETPPGHWHAIANEVSDHPALVHRWRGEGAALERLEWDVRLYLALGGAVHDAAVAAWELKRTFLGVRPITLIRYMASLGQSSDPSAPSYHPDGLPLIPGTIELVTEASSAPGQRHAHLARYRDQLVVRSWRGEPGDRKHEVGGVAWIRGVQWNPYQRRTFVTPPFPGYISGHSTFSRAAAEVLAGATGSPFFPGGLGHLELRKDAYLVFEKGPSEALDFQWATYFDASDQSGQSRLWGGIHIEADDIPGRRVGSAVGRDALARAERFFAGDAR
jgi:hypothetical protein